MLVLNSASVFFLPAPEVPISFTVHDSGTRLTRHKYIGSDALFFEFDLDVDASALFNWNTKHVFLYIIAEYNSTKSVNNQVVVWDTIIEKKEDSKISLQNTKVEYPLLDYAQELREREVRYTIQWSISPIA